MDLRLQFLESFTATGSDGQAYKVCAYDRLARAVTVGGLESWESTGQAEYRLADGKLVDVRPGGKLRIVGTEVELTPAEKRHAPA